MAHLSGIKNDAGRLADKIFLDLHATFIIVRESKIIDDLALELPPFEAKISWMRKVGDVEEGCFSVASLACRLRFPLLGFILEIIGEYEIVSSQLAPNS